MDRDDFAGGFAQGWAGHFGKFAGEIAPPSRRPQPGERIYHDRPGEILSLFGPITLRRDYCYRPGDPDGGEFPPDQALGMQEHCTPAAARLICRTATHLAEAERLSAEKLAVELEKSKVPKG